MYTTRKTQLQRGMTLVELLVTISITALLMLVITTSVQSLYRTNAYAISQAYQLDLARRGIETLTKDLREMNFANDGAFPLVRMESHLVGFYSDVAAPFGTEYIEYELSTTTTFTKRVYYPSSTVPMYAIGGTPDEEYIMSDFVQNLLQSTSTFLYFRADGTQTINPADIADVRYIKAQVIVNVDAERNPGEYMLRTSALIRNLKDAL